jgi:hypothetical protein
VLKKAGIVVAATAATLLVLSPLAYAGGSPEEKNRSHGTEQSAQEEPPGGLIDDVDVLSNLNVCPDVNVSAAVGNVLGILGLGGASTSTADAPINCTVNDTDG